MLKQVSTLQIEQKCLLPNSIFSSEVNVAVLIIGIIAFNRTIDYRPTDYD